MPIDPKLAEEKGGHRGIVGVQWEIVVRLRDQNDDLIMEAQPLHYTDNQTTRNIGFLVGEFIESIRPKYTKGKGK